MLFRQVHFPLKKKKQDLAQVNPSGRELLSVNVLLGCVGAAVPHPSQGRKSRVRGKHLVVCEMACTKFVTVVAPC